MFVMISVLNCQKREWRSRMGPFPFEGDEPADIIQCRKANITTLQEPRFFDSAQVFGMISWQHVHLTILEPWRSLEG